LQDEKRWLDLRQAAEYISGRVRTIREAIWSGRLRRARIGKKFLVDREELDRWVEREMRLEIDPEKAVKSGRKRYGSR
jgi:excisionase family DNA binding protein